MLIGRRKNFRSEGEGRIVKNFSGTSPIVNDLFIRRSIGNRQRFFRLRDLVWINAGDTIERFLGVFRKIKVKAKARETTIRILVDFHFRDDAGGGLKRDSLLRMSLQTSSRKNSFPF